MSCLQAKHLGAKQTIALINRKTYVPLIEDSPIDHAISPELITVGNILTKVRRGYMVKVHRLHNTSSEMLEVALMNPQEHAHLIQKKISEIQLPNDCHIVGIIRQNELHPPSKQFKLKIHDHLIVLVLDKEQLHALEYFFQHSS